MRLIRFPTYNCSLCIKLALSSAPSAATLEYAEEVIHKSQNPQRSAPGLTWAEILKEEPFEGQHWEGVYGLPPGSIANGDGTYDSAYMSSSSSISISDEDSQSEASSVFGLSDTTHSSERVPISPLLYPRNNDFSSNEERISESLSLRNDLEVLQKKQYWRRDWRIDLEVNSELQLGNPSTLGL